MKKCFFVTVAILLGSTFIMSEPAEAKRYKHRKYKHSIHRVVESPTHQWFSGSLVARARAHLGTNPTGWRRLWCARFMATIAPNAAARVRSPNQARSWASLPRVSPQVGAIAVLSRGRRGGHIGVVTGFASNGNPIIISGNHNRVVGESEYPRSRVIAWVSEDSI
ncbi:MAG: CHAP domain-containing protein [Desulfurellales bacterium]|nr:MAG: CHAP domain-containing protein [Desulfurellales bacterium]